MNDVLDERSQLVDVRSNTVRPQQPGRWKRPTVAPGTTPHISSTWQHFPPPLITHLTTTIDTFNTSQPFILPTTKPASPTTVLHPVTDNATKQPCTDLRSTRQWLLLTRWEYLCNWGGSGAFALHSRRRLQLWLCIHNRPTNVQANHLTVLHVLNTGPHGDCEATGHL
jgi:hypothetical protein